jgi:hypothetical protein
VELALFEEDETRVANVACIIDMLSKLDMLKPQTVWEDREETAV